MRQKDRQEMASGFVDFLHTSNTEIELAFRNLAANLGRLFRWARLWMVWLITILKSL